MDTVKIALIDVIGLTYDPTTLENYGLGGSESAVVYQARELQKLGFEVTVFNNCIDSRAKEGIYDGVRYVDLSRLHQPNDYTCDVMISSRTVIPFLTPEHWKDFNYPAAVFQQLKNSAKLKILILHDTFCSGDHLVEPLAVAGHIDQIFTLSDFQTSYITNCQHGGARRNFEVLKKKIFMTRNGARKYPNVDVDNKDPMHFVYNASITKGMLPLIHDVWPEVKRRLPNARLTVIGGYYRFRDGAEPDAQEKMWHELVAKDEFKRLDVTFTGVIPQREIAHILGNASFMIYPGAFPETFGISSLESLLYNTPIITTNFGALEETAIDLACYKIDYAIEPNNLFPEINKAEQVKKFVDAVMYAVNTPYLHYQKKNACRQVWEIAGWDTVMLQWKQQIYKTLGLYLPIDEYRRVTKINHLVHKIYGRRFSNPVENLWPNQSKGGIQRHILVVSPVYNGEAYIRDCILSVAQQDYENYTHVIVDDCSTDNTWQVINDTINALPDALRHRFVPLRNKANRGSVFNYYNQISSENIPDSIVMMLDGDDALVNDPSLFSYYEHLYQDRVVQFTYGSMWSQADNIPLIAQEYPESVKQNKTYREHLFPWNMPYTHLRTVELELFQRHITETMLKDDNGEWLRAGGDTAFFYNLIEAADPDKVYAVPFVVYKYNDLSPINDYKVNGAIQTQTAKAVLSQKTAVPRKKKILMAIPTAKYIEVETFRSLWDLEVPDDVELDFRYSYGYNIAQVRNLIASWTKDYDYLFSVDSDIVLPKDTLVKLLSHDKDIISGVYIQRKPDVQVPEIYRWKGHHLTNVFLDELLPQGLQKIDACGFGCVLVKSEVFQKIGYPQFEYTNALDHRNTVSEDVHFALKAAEHGFAMYVDSTIVCGHVGSFNYIPR